MNRNCPCRLVLYFAAVAAASSIRPTSKGMDSWLNLEKMKMNAPEQDMLCWPIPALILEKHNFTEEEYVMLDMVCWNRILEIDEKLWTSLGRTDGVPHGVDCKRTAWCDASGFCSDICKRGSVILTPWLSNSIRAQISWSMELPLNHAQFLGSHNSAITMANGYGSRDAFFTHLLSRTFIWQKESIETNDQWFSLTDQLNMGARLLELDVHWVKGALRIAHCGGFSNKALDNLIHLLNVVAKLAGYSRRLWDTETIGCSPSLSSISADDQRLFKDALHEIHAWLQLDQHKEQFVIVYLDTEMDLKYWRKLRIMIREIISTFGQASIFRPKDNKIDNPSGWPTSKDIVAMGKNVMFVCRQPYGEKYNTILFNRSWEEVSLSEGEQTCGWTMNGTALRVPSCELRYGTLNCQFRRGPNGNVLNDTTLPMILNCGINYPSPDRLTPMRAASSVWSWAPGEPKPSFANPLQKTTINATDGLWRFASASNDTPIACRKDGNGIASNWILVDSEPCPEGYVYGHPRNAKENGDLRKAIIGEGSEIAIIKNPAQIDHIEFEAA